MLLVVTCLACHLLSPQAMGQPSGPLQGHVARQRDLMGMGRGQPKSHTITIPCQERCCRVCSQIHAGWEGTRPGKVQLSELSVLRKQSRTGDTPMLPICSPVSQLPPHTHTQKQVVDTTCGYGQVIPMLLQPHILSLPKKGRNQTLCFLLGGTHAFAVSHRNYKTDFFSFQMKKKITPK